MTVVLEAVFAGSELGEACVLCGHRWGGPTQLVVLRPDGRWQTGCPGCAARYVWGPDTRPACGTWQGYEYHLDVDENACHACVEAKVAQVTGCPPEVSRPVTPLRSVPA